MHFDLETAHPNVAYKLMTGLIAPRPIALVTTISENGVVNVAPFSAYNYLCTDPPIVGIGVADRELFVPKDTARNIRRTNNFVVNVVTDDIADKMNLTGAEFPPEVSELEAAGFTTIPSDKVKAPRLAEAHAALECVEHSTIEIGRSRIILGRIVAIHVDDQFVDPKGPYVNAEALGLVGRMNGRGNYARTRDAFFKINRVTYDELKNS